MKQWKYLFVVSCFLLPALSQAADYVEAPDTMSVSELGLKAKLVLDRDIDFNLYGYNPSRTDTTKTPMATLNAFGPERKCGPWAHIFLTTPSEQKTLHVTELPIVLDWSMPGAATGNFLGIHGDRPVYRGAYAKLVVPEPAKSEIGIASMNVGNMGCEVISEEEELTPANMPEVSVKDLKEIFGAGTKVLMLK